MRYAHRFVRLVLAAVAFVTVLSIGAPRSYASVSVLSGGDATDGWVAPAPADVLFAYTLNGPTVSIQSVSFASWTAFGSAAPANTAGVTVTTTASGASFFAIPPSYASPTADDTNMASMMNTIFYDNANSGVGPLTFTMTGFTPNTAYLVEAFTFSDGVSTRTNETFKFNGVTTDVFDEAPGSIPASYLVEDNITANSTGQIALGITSPVGGTPPLSGLLIATAIPEPSSLALLGVGGLLLARRRRMA